MKALQRLAKMCARGCVNLGCKFTQPRAKLIAHYCLLSKVDCASRRIAEGVRCGMGGQQSEQLISGRREIEEEFGENCLEYIGEGTIAARGK